MKFIFIFLLLISPVLFASLNQQYPVDGSGYLNVDVKTPVILTSGSSTIGTVNISSGADVETYPAPGDTWPVSGTFWQTTQPVSVASGGSSVLAQISGVNSGSSILVYPSGGATFPVSGTFWQGTQPISISTGGSAVTATMAAGTDIQTYPASGDTWPVSGTFWQATQPISGSVSLVSGGSVSLLTGTSTIGTVNIASGSTASVVNPASGYTWPVSGTFWQTTQPVSGTVSITSGASISLLTGTSTIGSVNQAGSPWGVSITGTSTVLAVPPAGYNYPVTIQSGGSTVQSVQPSGYTYGVSITGTSTVTAGGPNATGVTPTVNPLRMAGVAFTNAPTAQGNGTLVDLQMTTTGAQVMKPYSVDSLDWQSTSGVSPITTSNSTALHAAGGVSIRNYLTALQLINSSGASTNIQVLDGGNKIWTYWLNVNAGQALPVVVQFPTPLRGSTATAMNLQAGTTGANIYWDAQGYQAP